MRLARLLNSVVCLAFIGLTGFPVDTSAQQPIKPQLAAPQLPKAELPEKSDAVTAVYAEHLAVSLCGSEYKAKFLTGSDLSAKDRAQFNSHVTTVCKCVYNNMASQVSAPGIVDYVMYSRARMENYQKPPADYLAYTQTPEFGYASNAFTNLDTRKKCGFVK